MKPVVKMILLLLLLVPAAGFSQTVVNIYARVTAISGTTLTIVNTTGSFTTGEAIIMQVQDSTIGNNTGNNSGFGNLASIQSAGISEVVSITSASAGSVTLVTAPKTSFHFNNNSRVQLISYPTLGSGNYTLNVGITAAPWNGNTGGVVAFKVNGNLTLNSNITTDAQGFRGGAAGNNAPGDGTCDPATYYDNAGGVNTSYYGFKGEGIHNTNGVFMVGRGKIANGGGGGNLNNSGGGGGGNLSAGGSGGLGWTCSATTSGAGVAGIDLSSYVSGTRFFFGGGGGGGQQNNNVGSAGGNGGGVIMIKASSIITSSGCNGGGGKVIISAKGGTAANSGNDGAGGGGAGGSIIMQVGSYTIANGCPLTLNTSGGDGGNVNDAGAHGGGAGGGKGVTILAGVVGTPANTTVIDTAGKGGTSANTGGAPAATGGGTVSNSGSGGTIFTSSSLLPVLLSRFEAAAVKNTAVLQWQSAVENNFAFYQVERSVNNGLSFTAIGKAAAKGSNAIYSFTDNLNTVNLAGTTVHYRLKMVDQDGYADYSSVKAISFNQLNSVTLKSFPNPVRAMVYITSAGITGNSSIQATVHDMQGRLVKTIASASTVAANTIVISMEECTKGQYIITINGKNGQEHTVVTKQ
jgi:Secretion system C-terminal sorting domain